MRIKHPPKQPLWAVASVAYSSSRLYARISGQMWPCRGLLCSNWVVIWFTAQQNGKYCSQQGWLQHCARPSLWASGWKLLSNFLVSWTFMLLKGVSGTPVGKCAEFGGAWAFQHMLRVVQDWGQHQIPAKNWNKREMRGNKQNQAGARWQPLMVCSPKILGEH